MKITDEHIELLTHDNLKDANDHIVNLAKYIEDVKDRAAAHDKAVKELLAAIDTGNLDYLSDGVSHQICMAAIAVVREFQGEEEKPLAALRGSGDKPPDGTTSQGIVAKMRDNDWGDDDDDDANADFHKISRDDDDA